ncbi:hypothetical protein D3C87_894010 [compost metagenome]
MQTDTTDFEALAVQNKSLLLIKAKTAQAEFGVLFIQDPVVSQKLDSGSILMGCLYSPQKRIIQYDFLLERIDTWPTLA